jgi:hypothetical protein
MGTLAPVARRACALAACFTRGYHARLACGPQAGPGQCFRVVTVHGTFEFFYPSQPETPPSESARVSPSRSRSLPGPGESIVTSRGPIIISPGARTDDSDGHWHTRAQRHCCTGAGGRAHSDVTVSPTVRVRVTESSCLTELQVLQVPGLPGARRRAGPVGRAGPAAAEPGSESG